MDNRQVEAIPVQPKNTKQQEDLYMSLPDLYIRKYILSEKLCSIKKPYVPKVNLQGNTNQEILRVPKIWQQVMSDVQKKALDFQERKKWKIAVNYQLAQEAKSTHQLMQKEREEIEQFGICISYQMSQMIHKAFQGMEIEDANQKSIQKYIQKINYEPQQLDRSRFEDALQKVKRYLASNRDVYVSLESLFPEIQPNYSESNTQDICDRRKIKCRVDFDFKKKYENIQEMLQLFVNKDISIKEQFEKSIMGIEEFPKTIDAIYKYKPQQYFQEPCLDPDYEELLYRYGCTPEQVLSDGERMMKKMKIFATNQVNDTPLPPQLELRDLFRYKFNYIERDCNFIQQNGKFVALDGERFNSHIQKINRTNEIVKQYFIYYYQKFQGDYNCISFALQSNTVTANLYLYTNNFCADLYAWLVYNKCIPTQSKFILPQQYPKKCCFIKQRKLPQQQVHYTNILNDYENQINKKLPIKVQNFRNLPQLPTKLYVKELQSKIKFEEPIQIKQTGQADYSMIEKLSFSNLKELVKNISNSKGFIDKRYKNVYEIARQDCQPIDLVKKEFRRNQRSTQINRQNIYGMQMPANQMMHRQMPQGPPVPGITNAQPYPPKQIPSQTLPQQAIETIGNQSHLIIPSSAPQPPPKQVEQQPIQPPPVVEKQPPPQQPPTQTTRPRKKTEIPPPVQPPIQPPQAVQPPQPVQQATTGASGRKKVKKEEAPPVQTTETQVQQEPQPPAPKQNKRTKKQTKGNEKNKQQHQEEDKDEGA